MRVPIALGATIALAALLSTATVARADIEVEYHPATPPVAQSSLSMIDLSGGADDIQVFQGATQVVLTRVGGGLVPVAGIGQCTGNGQQLLCPRASAIRADLGDGDDHVTTTSVTASMIVIGGPGNDRITGGAGDDIIVGSEGDDVLTGGAGNDFLVGFAGRDAFSGESGNDTIDALDGLPERVECGPGADVVSRDPGDQLVDCEPIADGDSDGFSPAVDCNDADPRIFRGAPEIRDNGVDEDCDGRDALNLDRDGDGFAAPQDCNDADPLIRPNALEIRGNAVDENCDERAAPFTDLAVLVSNRWKLERTYTSLRTLVVRLAPKGARIVLRCSGSGCPRPRERVQVVPGDLVPVPLQRAFRRARLRPGTRITLTITAPESVGRTFRYTIKRSEPPAVAKLCRAPGDARGRAC